MPYLEIEVSEELMAAIVAKCDKHRIGMHTWLVMALEQAALWDHAQANNGTMVPVRGMQA